MSKKEESFYIIFVKKYHKDLFCLIRTYSKPSSEAIQISKEYFMIN